MSLSVLVSLWQGVRSGVVGWTGRAWFIGLSVLLAAPAQGNGRADQKTQGDSEWVIVHEWTGGPGQTITDVFAPAQGPWRVSYEALSGSRWGLLDIFVRTKDDQYVGGALNVQPLAFGEDRRSGSFLVNGDYGEYKLEIASDRIEWHVAVEERQ